MDVNYTLHITCCDPHGSYSRTIPFRWHPDAAEIHDSIRRLRDQAAKAGVTEIVKIRRVTLTKTAKVEVTLDDSVVGYTATFTDPII